MINFNKIKAMSIDEMAEELYIHLGEELYIRLGGCSACVCYFICKKHDIGKHHCIGMYKQWLESESEEEQ